MLEGFYYLINTNKTTQIYSADKIDIEYRVLVIEGQV